MNLYNKSDAQLALEFGERIQLLRLNKNITQQAVAEEVGCTIKTIAALEKGRGKLETLFAVLRALQGLEHLDAFLPPVEISPIDLLKRKGHLRKRARPESHSSKSEENLDW